MGRARRDDRRRRPTRLEDRPRASAASLILLTVSGVLLATAAATAIFGNGFSDATPHERLLGVLDRVAEEQADHRRETGWFSGTADALGVEVPAEVELYMMPARPMEWEAVARSPEHGLSCSLTGQWDGDRAVRAQPVCYRDGS